MKAHIWAYTLCIFIKVLIVIDVVNNRECHTYCLTLCYVKVAVSVCILTLVLIQMVRFLRLAKHRQHYLYNKLRLNFVLQTTVLLAGLAANVYFDLMQFGDSDTHTYVHSMVFRLVLYFTNTAPLIVVYFLAHPTDLFSVFNMYPEQLKRVSFFQYPNINYFKCTANGPLTDCESFLCHDQAE